MAPRTADLLPRVARRSLLQGLLFLALGIRPGQAVPQVATPAATIRTLDETLLAVMRQGKALGFAGRRDRLAPAIRTAFDLPRMTRLMVGPQWHSIEPAQQQRLVAAFSDFSIAVYASRFNDWSGERFDLDPAPTPAADGQEIIHTRLVESDGNAVQLDYLLHNGDGAWLIVDVFLSGTISELATRRSEFSSVLRRDGADALVTLLQQRTAQLSS